MVKEKNSVGLSRDYIIHPGETLAEVLEDREMSQRELAVRTGMTEKLRNLRIEKYTMWNVRD